MSSGVVYAAPDDYAAWAGLVDVDTDDPELLRRLQRASELIDDVLRGALYDADPITHLPTDAGVALAMNDAVCAQVEWWAANQDELNEFERWHKIATTDQGFSVERLPGRMPALAPRARAALKRVRLLPPPILLY